MRYDQGAKIQTTKLSLQFNPPIKPPPKIFNFQTWTEDTTGFLLLL